MTSILDLIEGDWVQFIGDNGQSQYGKFEHFVEDIVLNVFDAKLKLPNGQTYTLTEDDDFVIVDYPINFKVDNVHQPSHYQFGRFSANVIIELVGKTYKSASVFYHVGNALKYLMRAPRKNGLEDLQKAKQSIEFAIECWEG